MHMDRALDKWRSFSRLELALVASPIIAFLTVAISIPTRRETGDFFGDRRVPYLLIVISSVLSFAHFGLVFLRTHMNRDVFRAFVFRFTVVPALLFIAGYFYEPVLIAMGTVALFWSYWHNAMQTFGLGRMMDHGLGPGKDGDGKAGRAFDKAIAFTVTTIPLLILLSSAESENRTRVIANYFSVLPVWSVELGALFFRSHAVVIILSVAGLMFYLISQLLKSAARRREAQGKFALYFLTGAVSLATAFVFPVIAVAILADLYHSLQYFFIVAQSERKTLSHFGRFQTKFPQAIFAYAGFIVPLMIVIGLIRFRVSRSPDDFHMIITLWVVITLLHYWYDGFIWSVRNPLSGRRAQSSLDQPS